MLGSLETSCDIVYLRGVILPIRFSILDTYLTQLLYLFECFSYPGMAARDFQNYSLTCYLYIFLILSSRLTTTKPIITTWT